MHVSRNARWCVVVMHVYFSFLPPLLLSYAPSFEEPKLKQSALSTSLYRPATLNARVFNLVIRSSDAPAMGAVFSCFR